MLVNGINLIIKSIFQSRILDYFNPLIKHHLYKKKSILKITFFHLYPFVQLDTEDAHNRIIKITVKKNDSMVESAD